MSFEDDSFGEDFEIDEDDPFKEENFESDVDGAQDDFLMDKDDIFFDNFGEESDDETEDEVPISPSRTAKVPEIEERITYRSLPPEVLRRMKLEKEKIERGYDILTMKRLAKSPVFSIFTQVPKTPYELYLRKRSIRQVTTQCPSENMIVHVGSNTTPVSKEDGVVQASEELYGMPVSKLKPEFQKKMIGKRVITSTESVLTRFKDHFKFVEELLKSNTPTESDTKTKESKPFNQGYTTSKFSFSKFCQEIVPPLKSRNEKQNTSTVLKIDDSTNTLYVLYKSSTSLTSYNLDVSESSEIESFTYHSFSKLTCFCTHPTMDKYILAGTSCGSLVLWKKNSKKIGKGRVGWPVDTSSGDDILGTESLKKESEGTDHIISGVDFTLHNSPVKKVLAVGKTQFFSLDSNGVIIIWTIRHTNTDTRITRSGQFDTSSKSRNQISSIVSDGRTRIFAASSFSAKIRIIPRFGGISKPSEFRDATSSSTVSDTRFNSLSHLLAVTYEDNSLRIFDCNSYSDSYLFHRSTPIFCQFFNTDSSCFVEWVSSNVLCVVRKIKNRNKNSSCKIMFFDVADGRTLCSDDVSGTDVSVCFSHTLSHTRTERYVRMMIGYGDGSVVEYLLSDSITKEIPVPLKDVEEVEGEGEAEGDVVVLDSKGHGLGGSPWKAGMYAFF